MTGESFKESWWVLTHRRNGCWADRDDCTLPWHLPVPTTPPLWPVHQFAKTMKLPGSTPETLVPICFGNSMQSWLFGWFISVFIEQSKKKFFQLFTINLTNTYWVLMMLTSSWGCPDTKGLLPPSKMWCLRHSLCMQFPSFSEFLSLYSPWAGVGNSSFTGVLNAKNEKNLVTRFSSAKNEMMLLENKTFL